MDGDPGLPTDFTSSTAPALASSVSSCTMKTIRSMTLRTSLTHPPKVSKVAGLEFGVTAKKKLLGLSSETGEGVFHSHFFSIAYVILIIFSRCLGCNECICGTSSASASALTGVTKDQGAVIGI